MRSLVSLGALLLLMAGCDGSSPVTSGGAGPSRTPTAVTVNPNGSNLLRIGQEQAYTASVRWSDGTETTEPAAWRSDVPAVATIDGAGRARAVESGDATIEGVAHGVGGHLRIRVVPDYQGAWLGEGIVRGCRDSGDWHRAGICTEVFPVGSHGPVGLVLGQDRDRVSGLLSLVEDEADLTPGLIRPDGSVGLTGRVVMSDEGLTLTLVFDPVELRAKADTMSGQFTMTGTGTGLSGDLVVEFEVPTLTRSAGILPTHQARGKALIPRLALLWRQRR